MPDFVVLGGGNRYRGGGGGGGGPNRYRGNYDDIGRFDMGGLISLISPCR